MKSRTKYAAFFILAGLGLFLAGCPETVDPQADPPPGVQIIENDRLESPIDAGIRALEGTQRGVVVEWQEIEEAGVIIFEYQVFRSKQSIDSPFVAVGNVIVNTGQNNSEFIDLNVGLDTTYHYFVPKANYPI